MSSTDPTAMVGLMPAPPDVTPDFYHTTPVQISFIAVFTVTFALATIALLLRVYTRVMIVKSVGLDEPLLVSAWAVTLAFFIVSVQAMPAGFGRNLYEVTQMQLVGYLERLLSLALTYIWPPTLTKLSILVLYWRINPDRIFRACLIATALVLVGYTVTFSVLFIGPCNPLLGTPESAVCLNNIAVSQAVLNIVTDGVLIILPIPTIHRLNMGLRQRITVGLILGLGSAACIASIVRVAYVRVMVDNPDVTFTQCSAAVWSLLEMNLGILCNSLAALKPFVRHHLPTLFSTTDGDSGGNNQSDSYANTKNKRSKGGGSKGGARGWGHSYQLHSVGGGGGGKDAADIVVDHQFSVEYDSSSWTKGGARTPGTSGTGGSTESILAPQYPAHQPV
ncbi:puromycin-sensitive aminopeptidase [Chaetomidium leptoderma]|uniref:Puromycin-sensitive aminopeptidase n=1 Tax=Chaetomidium leptoderma TaxID=669021 RepID=A0AAN6VES5_9PEZI|nr:puromycin-sensitive aminopeptidase [Chaetomidium leptoderma]